MSGAGRISMRWGRAIAIAALWAVRCALPAADDPSVEPAGGGSVQSTVEGAQPPETHPRWDKPTLDLLSRLPIQDDGRVKPLSTFANFKLVVTSGRMRCVPPGEEDRPRPRRVPALYWLLDCLFRPEIGEQYRVIRIENPAVIQALGLPDRRQEQDRKWKYFRYAELAPKEQRLLDMARGAAEVEEEKRDLFQRQILNLFSVFTGYQRLLRGMEFARFRQEIVPGSPLAALLEGADLEQMPDGLLSARYSTLLVNMPLLVAALGADLEHQRSTEVDEVWRRLDAIAGHAVALRVLPRASDPQSEEWLSPGTLYPLMLQPRAPLAEWAHLTALERLHDRAAEPAAFRRAAAELIGAIRASAADLGQYEHIGLEIFFYKAKFFRWALVLYLLGFLLVAASWLAPRGRWLGRVAVTGVVVPTLVLIAGITVRCIIRGRPPVTTLYETTLFIPAVAIVAALAAEWLNPKRIALAVASVLGCMGMFLANKFELRGSDTMESMIAVLNSNFWLSTHVTTVTIGYSAGLLACAIAHIHVIGHALGLARRKDFMRSVARMTYGVICFGTLFAFVGTVLGGIWANYSWGRFWGWDPKENGALMIILWNLFILHARMGGYLRDLGTAIAAIFGGIIVAFSWWGVNLLGVGLHSYGFLSGIQKTLYTYWLIEIGVIALGMMTAIRLHLQRRLETSMSPQLQAGAEK